MQYTLLFIIGIITSFLPVFGQQWKDNISGHSNLISGIVHDITYNNADSIVYIVGDFSVNDSIGAWNIAGIDLRDSSLVSFTNVPYYPSHIILFNDTLFIGGNFNDTVNSISYLAKWDGTDWVSVGDLSGAVTSMHVFDSSLYIAGRYDSLNGWSTKCIGVWDGSSWDTLSGSPNGSITAMTHLDSTLYVTGAFTQIGSDTLLGIAKWHNNSWESLSDGFSGQGYAITTKDTLIYVAGDFSITLQDSSTISHLVSWDGTDWNEIEQISNPVGSMTFIEDTLYISARSYIDSIQGSAGGSVFQLKPSVISLGSGIGFVNTLEAVNNTLLSGGSFIRFNDSIKSYGIAFYLPSTSNTPVKMKAPPATDREYAFDIIRSNGQPFDVTIDRQANRLQLVQKDGKTIAIDLTTYKEGVYSFSHSDSDLECPAYLEVLTNNGDLIYRTKVCK